jgi:hypothetical protein
VHRSDNIRVAGAPHLPYHIKLHPRKVIPGLAPERTSILEGARLIMVYDWDGKREICYQMYIKDRKALEEIMEYMRNVYQFSPR